MNEKIKNRLEVIISVIVGTGSGFGMAELIDTPELKTRLVIIAIASSLLVSLLVSFYLNNKTRQLKRKAAWRVIIWSISVFILSIGGFFYSHDQLTVSYPVEDNKMNIVDTVKMVKGLYYAEPAKRYIEKVKKESHITLSDKKLLERFAFQTDMIWTNKSRTFSKLIILFLYTFLICSFIAGITAFSEVISTNKKTPK